MPFGVGALEGQAGAPLRVIEAGEVASDGGEAGTATPATPAPEYGPGEEPRPREGEPTAAAHGELL